MRHVLAATSLALLMSGCFHAGAPVRSARVLDPREHRVSLQHTWFGSQATDLPEYGIAQRHPYVPEALAWLLLPGVFANTQVRWATSPEFGEEVSVSLGLQEIGLEWRHAVMDERRMLWRDDESGEVTFGWFDVATSAMIAVRPLTDPTTPWLRAGVDVSKDHPFGDDLDLGLFGDDLDLGLSLGAYVSWGPEAYLNEGRLEVSREARLHIPLGVSWLYEEGQDAISFTLGFTPFVTLTPSPTRAIWGQHITLGASYQRHP